MKNKLLYVCIALILVGCAKEKLQKEYSINSPTNHKEIRTGHLDMGGISPTGGSIDINSYYMSENGKPIVPVMGEFHFSRYPVEQWEEEIVKMKAGGVTIIPTYIFWSLHQPKEGVWDWSGNRNLRHFIELCQKHNMPVIVRIGPFCHGEMRQGGFPDWLFAKPLVIRSNDSLYLHYVNLHYQEIGKQLTGLYYKDGGPIIGCQIENEMQHSASPWGIIYPTEPFDYTSADYDKDITLIGVGVQTREITTKELGEEHMRTLLQMAKDAGIITPFYTATGWGYAAVIDNKAIPVTSAYTYPFWEEPRMSPFCMFKDIHTHPDYEPVRYTPTDFPSFCAEMGAGIQMIYARRPIVTARAAQALMIRTLGSGCNGIGYYMYHGGSTPLRADGIGSNQDEPMGMPKISYDFQAPLGEFGLENESYRYLRTIHSFLNDFGADLAPMETVLPEDWDKMTPDNREDLRWAARLQNGRGFLFLVNFQDHDTARHDMKGLNIMVDGMRIPQEGTFTLPKDESMILPINMDLSGITLHYATAQPLMKINDNGIDHYFFFAPVGISPEYLFEGTDVKRVEPGLESTFSVLNKNGEEVRVTTLTHEQALDAVKVNGKLLITKASVLPYTDHIELLQLSDNHFSYIQYPSNEGFAVKQEEVEMVEPQCDVRYVGTRRASVHFDALNERKPQVQEYFLQIDYTADVAMAFLGAEMVQDEFWHAMPWRIGLNRHEQKMHTNDMSLYFRPLYAGHTCLQDLPQESVPDFSKGPVLDIRSITIVPQYKLTINNK